MIFMAPRQNDLVKERKIEAKDYKNKQTKKKTNKLGYKI